MSDIGPIGGGASASEVSRPRLDSERESRPGQRAEARPPRRGPDRVEVSSLARELAAQQDPVRQDLIDRVRAEIEAGTYETAERLDGAVDRLLSELDQPRPFGQ